MNFNEEIARFNSRKEENRQKEEKKNTVIYYFKLAFISS